MIPSEEEFPYAIRVVSEAVSSNGSTSMASVCGSTLSLMDAGVPIKAPVAGAAMGLIKDTQSDKVAVLTDIQGLEDFLGDMDFKVAGTEKGITAIQMDIKIKGIDEPILKRALAQAKDARLFILNKMLATLDRPRDEVSPYAPKTIIFYINTDKIREVIGPGGKMINKIIDETGVKIDIEDSGPGNYICCGQRFGRGGQEDDRRNSQGRRGRRGVSGNGRPHNALRSVCRIAARQGRLGAYFQAGKRAG